MEAASGTIATTGAFLSLRWIANRPHLGTCKSFRAKLHEW